MDTVVDLLFQFFLIIYSIGRKIIGSNERREGNSEKLVGFQKTSHY